MHPWHDVSLGKQAPNLVPVVIEVPKGSKNKYELDKESGRLRVACSSVPFTIQLTTASYLRPIAMTMIRWMCSCWVRRASFR